MASQKHNDDDVEGCVGCFLVLLAIGAAVAAVMAVAALVDPFSWVPPIEDVFSQECMGDKCDLEERYPGFWGHVIVNFAYACAALVLVGGLLESTSRLRKTRAERFAGPTAVEQFRAARVAVTWWALGMALLAAVPFLAAG